jgi:glycosyltransferase involved in cell wall biosynthesis
MNNLTNSFIVVHAGKRDDYQVALALEESNMLHSVVTECYFPLDKKWFYTLANIFGVRSFFLKRYKDNLPSHKVTISYRALLNHLLYLFSKKLKYDVNKGYFLGKKARLISLKLNIPIIAVNTCAADAFIDNKVNPKILFQFHPHASFVRELFEEELLKNPKSKVTLKQEYEFSLSNEAFYNLSNEVGFATHFICASSITKKSLISQGVIENRIKIIPYGVDTSKFIFKERIKSDIFKVIFIGSLNQRKGISYLLDALTQLEDIELTIVTRGIYDHSLIENYNFPINILIDISHEKLLQELHNSHCFVLPSILEGFGQVILEAMATGIPVVASENTAAIDIIEDGVDGYVIKIRDIDAIKEKIKNLQLNFSLVKRIGKMAHKKAKIYTWEKFRKDLVNHIKTIE